MYETSSTTNNFHKRNNLDEIFIFENSLLPEHQLIEKSEKIAKRHVLSEVEVNFLIFCVFGVDSCIS